MSSSEPGQAGKSAMETGPEPGDGNAAVRVRGRHERLLRTVEESLAVIPASLVLTVDQAMQPEISSQR